MMATWQKGQNWRVVGSLETLLAQTREYAPRSAPPATNVNTWGAIADDEHDSSSDHYPHYYKALGSTAVVCARDFPHAPALGLDAVLVTEALRVSRDARIGYIIFNRRITGPNHSWGWDAYTGDDPHDTHFHVSTVHTKAADNSAPWTLPGGDMSGEADAAFVKPYTGTEPWVNGQSWMSKAVEAPLTVIRQQLAALATDVTAIKSAPRPTVDVMALADALRAALPQVSREDIVAALNSAAGQQALIAAANAAEDS